jgi:hypothetical protein
MAPTVDTKDVLTELLDEEVAGWEEEIEALQKQIPADEDDDVIDDDGDDAGDDDQKKGVDDDDPLAVLQAKLEDAEKQRRGMYNDLKTERRTRQELSGQINSLTQTVQQILQQRQAAVKTPEPEKQAITFEFNEDGEAYIQKDQLKSLTLPLEQEILNLRAQIQATTGHLDAEAATNAAIQKIVGEDDAFSEALPVYQKARTWANNAVIEWSNLNNINQELTSAQALNYVFDEDMVEEFGSKFPGVDLEHVVTAQDGEYHFRRTLTNIAKALTKEDVKDELPVKKGSEKFKKLLAKPTGLGTSTNKGVASKSILDVSESLSGLDALELSDAQVRALERALLKEEQVGGIKF